MVAPTVRSMPPTARTMVMPRAMMSSPTLACATVARLSRVRNQGDAALNTPPATRQATKRLISLDGTEARNRGSPGENHHGEAARPLHGA